MAFYLSHDVFLGATSLDYALIGGFNFALAMLVAPLATLMGRLYGPRVPMFLGVILLPSGFSAASFAQEVWQLYLSQGAAEGLGVGLIYIPAIAVLSQWFHKRRSLANSISSAGSGIGGPIMCFTTGALIQGIGYMWALRVTAFIVFGVNLFAIIFIRSRNSVIQPN